MLNGIDISNWQGRLDISMIDCDFVIAKATGGTHFVDEYCDGTVQQCRNLGRPWGFYHFANDGAYHDAVDEADFFYEHTKDYFGKGIPILDWEVDAVDANWVNTFVEHIYDITGVWCWIYANPWRFDGGDINKNCARWVAAYPPITRPGFDYIGTPPECDGNMCAWQYASDGKVAGAENINLDINHFYGDVDDWNTYVVGTNAPESQTKELGNVNVYYALKLLDGEWLDEVKNYDDTLYGFAGLPFHSHDSFYAKVDKGSIKYCTHTVGGDWSYWCYDGALTPQHGAIDGISLYYTTPDGYEHQQVWYHSQDINHTFYHGLCCDDGESVLGYDGWCGLYGNPLDRIQIRIGHSF